MAGLDGSAAIIVGVGTVTGVPAIADPRLGVDSQAVVQQASINGNRIAVADRKRAAGEAVRPGQRWITSGSRATLRATSRSAAAAPPAGSSAPDRPSPAIRRARPRPGPSASSPDAPPD